MVRAGGEPILMDFGLARSMNAKTQRLTHTGKPLGDPVKKDMPRKAGCRYTYTLDETCFPDVGTHPSDQVMEMKQAEKVVKTLLSWGS